jgi:hypothetical protein
MGSENSKNSKVLDQRKQKLQSAVDAMVADFNRGFSNSMKPMFTNVPKKVLTAADKTVLSRVEREMVNTFRELCNKLDASPKCTWACHTQLDADAVVNMCVTLLRAGRTVQSLLCRLSGEAKAAREGLTEVEPASRKAAQEALFTAFRKVVSECLPKKAIDTDCADEDDGVIINF